MAGPCKNCTNRKLGCHGSCEAYISFKKEKEEEKKERQNESLYFDTKRRILIKQLRKFHEHIANNNY